MFSKIRSAMLALAAVATLGLGAIVATTDSADARGFGGGFSRGGGSHIGGGHVGAGRHFGGGRVHIGGGRHIGHRPHIGHHRPHLHRHHVHFRHHWCHRFYRFGHRHCGVHVRWYRPLVATVAATTYAVAPTVTTARPCTCLTKEYTPDNLVVFKDLCTKEVASAPAGNTQVQLPAVPAQQ
jgi:hypothetical protein